MTPQGPHVPGTEAHGRSGRLVSALVAASVLLTSRQADAYIDPGTFSNLFGSVLPLIGLLLAGMGFLLWPFRWAVKCLWHWGRRRPALVRLGGGIARVFRPAVLFLRWVLWPVRRSASAVGSAAKAHPRRAFLVCLGATLSGVALGAWHFLWPEKRRAGKRSGKRHPRVIILGIDGLDPNVLGAMMQSGELGNFRQLSGGARLARLATSTPAHSPNAWTCIATGCDAGRHGVFDFIHRDASSYRLHLSVTRPGSQGYFGGGSPKFLPARRCPAFWELLSEAGIPATVVRWPVTFPPDAVTGHALSGLGVPDLRGGLGSYTFYTTRPVDEQADGREKVIVVEPHDGVVETSIPGPDVAGLTATTRSRIPLRIELHPAAGRVRLFLNGRSHELAVGQWSGRVRLSFNTGPLTQVAGLAAFHLKALQPHLGLYLSPIELDPLDPAFPISAPMEFACELAEAIGPYHTLGMPEDTNALIEGRIDADAFLQLCHGINAERERMLLHELATFEDGLLALVADTSDRLQHIFWVTRDPAHPLHDPSFAQRYAHVIPDVYRHADRLVGHVLQHADARTLVMVLSDHGFAPFRRAVHLNTWLAQNGFMLLQDGPSDPEGGALLKNVVWDETSAYALGFGGVYVNLKGREGHGAIPAGSEARAVCERIAAGLHELRDPKTGQRVVHRVYFRDDLYHGPLACEGPDLVVGFQPGYRASWQTALGGAPQGVFDDNRKLWSGDHIVDPSYVPGVILANRPLQRTDLRQADVAPTVLKEFSLPKSPAMTGEAFF